MSKILKHFANLRFRAIDVCTQVACDTGAIG